MKQRLLLLITDLQIGGTPTVVRELALRLRNEFDIHVACLSEWGPVADQLQQAGVAVTPLNAKHARDWRVIRRLVELIDRERIDTLLSFLVHANVCAAIAKRKRPGLRLIQSIQTTQSRPRWHWWAQRVAARHAEHIVVPSASVAEVAVKRCAILRERIAVIPNAIDPTQFHQVESTHDGTIRVGFIGRLDPVKRIGDLIQAMALLPSQYLLSIFGDGRERQALQHQIRSLELQQRVTLLGVIKSPLSALGQIDLLVLPSAAEGFGLVLIEAMAAGVPVIGTDVPGIRDVIRHEQNGLLVPAFDAQGLANGIQRLSENEKLRERFIAEGMHDVQTKYRWDAILPSYIKLLSGQ